MTDTQETAEIYVFPEINKGDFPCIPEDELPALLKKISNSSLIRDTKEGRIIGCIRDYELKYNDLVHDLNPETIQSFPLLFHHLQAALTAVGRKPVMPADLGLPAICLDGPIPTLLPSTYIDLITGHLTFKEPSGPCVQFHLHARGDIDILFA